MFNMELLGETLRFARMNTPKEPLLLHIARDVHIGCILGQAMQRLGEDHIPLSESHLVQIPCVLVSSRFI